MPWTLSIAAGVLWSLLQVAQSLRSIGALVFEVVAVKVMRVSLFAVLDSVSGSGGSLPTFTETINLNLSTSERARSDPTIAQPQPRQRVTRLRHLYPVNHCARGNPQSHARIDFSESIRVPRSVFEFLGRECLRSVPSMTWVSLSEVPSVSRIF